jgi:MFS family permease
MGLFAASSPLGFGAGPALGAFLIDQVHAGSASVFALAALFSLGVTFMLAAWSHEVRPEVVPTGSLMRLAFGAVRGVMADPIVRWLFVVYGLVFVGRQMSAQYMTLLIHDVEGTPLLVAGSIGLLGAATIVGAGFSPIGGWIADRLGFRPVLVAAIGGIALSFAALPLAPSVAWLAVAYSFAIAFQAVVGAMVSGLLATEVPSERRSATLNLIYLPLYLGGIAGPAIGANVVTVGLRAVFFAAALVLVGSLVVAIAFARRPGRSTARPPATSPDDGAAADASGPASV